MKATLNTIDNIVYSLDTIGNAYGVYMLTSREFSLEIDELLAKQDADHKPSFISQFSKETLIDNGYVFWTRGSYTFLKASAPLPSLRKNIVGMVIPFNEDGLPMNNQAMELRREDDGRIFLHRGYAG